MAVEMNERDREILYTGRAGGITRRKHEMDLRSSRRIKSERRTTDPLYGRSLREKLTRWGREARGWVGLRRTGHDSPGVVYAYAFRQAGVIKGPSHSVNGAEARRYSALSEIWKRTRVRDLEPELLFEVPFAEPYAAEQHFLAELRRRGVSALWGREWHSIEHEERIVNLVTGRLL